MHILDIVILIVAIVVIAIIFINQQTIGEGYYGVYDRNLSGMPYATLGSYGYTSPLFEPDVLRRCASGSYTYTSNPDLTSFCSTVPPQVLDRVACVGAFRGRPLRLEYTAPAYGSCNDEMSCGSTEPSLILS